MINKVVYPGSFDPVTNGHLEIIKRASKMFDKVIVAVFCNPNKNPLFSMEERVSFLEEATKDISGVKVDSFSGLTINYVESIGGNAAILRGLRAVSDFEGEFQMSSMNKSLNSEIETVFLMTEAKYAFLSSTIIKEAAHFNGDVRSLVPACVYQKLINKFND